MLEILGNSQIINPYGVFLCFSVKNGLLVSAYKYFHIN